ncbi:uncharacterized protein LOC118439223 [Folsomia candida]|uniref:Uncharacterized protein n=1 Tax=Folsomia candida TaxID=158441 RepID=A0A226F2Y9_FOLCA|nr:uncharacterized protein LOC118439223 [Folsomia candida]OXA64143.1 hypothetical protein Fcan01_03677 [Folsomia candida]
MGHRKFGTTKAIKASHTEKPNRKLVPTSKSISKKKIEDRLQFSSKRKTNEWTRNKVTEIDSTFQVLLKDPEVFSNKQANLVNLERLQPSMGTIEDFEMVLAITCEKINKTSVAD